ncbi:uncharacterized protein LOC115823546 [Chanos chanos]|uniref:Uncharacterized protein LOC115823546 n=1 Tax=Chanos chanos TaxID=29144 RepID=A0A6J2WJF3_CHACN|nr:uncharacterized protein LOC115823546 [Chanos chanos]
MENKWMARAIILLLVCLTRSLAKELTGNTTAGNASEEPRNPAKTDFSTKTFQIGRNVTLQCTSRTWNETIYVLWNITIGRKSCRITTAHNGPNTDTCNDGKALHNTSKGESYLFIPNFSKEDEGMYACETALYEKESHRENIKVSSWAMALLLLTYLICKHLSRASVFGKLCCKMNKTQTQATPASNKPPQNQDVEDVEPYASYVQRVNSIYNSSAELFNT